MTNISFIFSMPKVWLKLVFDGLHISPAAASLDIVRVKTLSQHTESQTRLLTMVECPVVHSRSWK